MAQEFVVKQEGNKRRLIIDYKGASVTPDLAAYPEVMREVIERLQENEADEIVLAEYYERIYNEEQTEMLKSVANLITKLETETVWSPSHLGITENKKVLSARHDAVLAIVNQSYIDPFGAYLELIKIIKESAVEFQKAQEAEKEDTINDYKAFLETLQFMKQVYDESKLIQKSKQYLAQLGKMPEGRMVYHSLFESAIKPSFIGSRIFFTGAETLELVDEYEVLESKVYIYKHPEKVEHLYYINPPEYTLPPEKYFLLQKTKEVVAGHRPASVGFMDMEQARKYFRKIYVATITDLANQNDIKLTVEEKEELATIVSRYTIGYGILELLLSDKKLTDVYLDSPLGNKPIYLVHSKYGQCQTNIIFSDEEAKAIVSRFRALSGRPFDEAHPILDFDLADLQTRIAVIGKPLALDGTAFALRLHKATPWTLAQFVDAKMMPSLAAGALSFFVDAQASMLVVGSRGAGKCLDGDTLIQFDNGNLVKIRDVVETKLKNAKELTLLDDGICAPCEGIEIFTMSKDLKVQKAKIDRVWKRQAPSEMYRIKLASGKEITTTPEHPFFLVENGKVIQKRADKLNTCEFIATPRQFKVETCTQVLTPDLAQLYKLKYTSKELMQDIQRDLQKMQFNLSEDLKIIAEKVGIKYSTLLNLKQGIRTAATLEEMLKISNYLNKNSVEYLDKASYVSLQTNAIQIPINKMQIELDEDLARFIGLLYGDGHIDEKKIEFTNINAALLHEFGMLAEKLFAVKGRIIRPTNRSTNYQLSSKTLNYLLKNMFALHLGDKAAVQTIPEVILQSQDNVVGAFLQGYFDCDASVYKNSAQIEFCTASKIMAEQIQLCLQRFGIISFLKPKNVNETQYYRLFIRGENCAAFQKFIGFKHLDKKAKLEKVIQKNFNSNVDIVPNVWSLIKKSKEKFGIGKKLDQKEYGRKTLQRLSDKIFEKYDEDGEEITKQIQTLAFSDLFWDKIIEIEKVKSKEEFVYDLTVNETHSFVANGIIAHNTSLLQAMMQEISQNLRILVQEDTQELPVPQLKQLGFNIQRLKTRPPLGTQSEAEVSAEDALRTALRLGDSVLIVGEVRSGEATALYEAMRVGAVGNVVMGTIHGESAYSIWDRVVNDLGVPTTSFKATDMVVVAAPIRFGGSLKRHRRLIEITEVKKEWTEDPGKENGFLNWMAFDANKDNMDLYKEEIKESEWIKKVMRNRGLTYTELWNEMITRGATKQFLVDLKNQHNIPALLEAENTIRAQTKYAIIAEKQREEHGKLDYKELLRNWQKWTTEVLAREVIGLKSLE